MLRPTIWFRVQRKEARVIIHYGSVLTHGLHINESLLIGKYDFHEA